MKVEIRRLMFARQVVVYFFACCHALSMYVGDTIVKNNVVAIMKTKACKINKLDKGNPPQTIVNKYNTRFRV